MADVAELAVESELELGWLDALRYLEHDEPEPEIAGCEP